MYSNWVFTLNHPDSHPPLPQIWERDQIKLLVFQEEMGKENTHHYQGYIEFSSRKRLTTVKKLNPFVHWEPRKGSRKQAIAYCTKLETRIPGTEPYWWPEEIKLEEEKEAKKDKYEALKEALNSGEPIQEVADKFFALWLRHHRALEAYGQLSIKPRHHKTETIAIYGPTGTGKSVFCHENFPDAFWKTKGNWWDGYTNQKVVIIDEFYGWLAYDFLLRLLDRYPLKVEVKGSFGQFDSQLVIITSNKGPSEWYQMKNIDALLRRLDHVWVKNDLDEPFQVLKGDTPDTILEKYGCAKVAVETSSQDSADGQCSLGELATLSQLLNEFYSENDNNSNNNVIE